MALFVIADLHLSSDGTKSMEKFGPRWTDYMQRLKKNWTAVVRPDDTVIIPGDISWSLKLEESLEDFRFLNSLPGKKLIGKGNHDFWWSTASKMKAFFSKVLNLIFIQNGYGKYCLDMEVNDISAIEIPCKYYVEVSLKALTDRLTREDKDLLLEIFVRDIDDLRTKMEEGKKYEKKVLILTEPLCTLDVREQIFKDIIAMYEKEAQVFIKPHPRDELDYATLFAQYPQFEGSMPMEMLNFFDDLHFDLVIGVLTELKAVTFAKETVRLGPDFMDQYEDPAIHRQNERIKNG